MSRFRSIFGSQNPIGFNDDLTDVIDTLVGRHEDSLKLARDNRTDDAATDVIEPDAAQDDQIRQTPVVVAATDNAAPAPAPTTPPTTTNTTPETTTDTSSDGDTTSTGHGHTHDPTHVHVLEGTEQADVLQGTYHNDEIHGRGGNDNIESSAGDDKLFGEEGNDTLDGSYGNDVLDGGAGNDTLRGGEGADTLIGGEGMDNASYVLATKGVMVDLATGGITNEAAGDTYSGIENLFGSMYGDILNGDSQANVIHGGSGDDYVFGQGGDDRLFGDLGVDVIRGGAGNDIINGGLGNDRLTGDDAGQFGRDTFVIRPGNGVDTITDFQRGYDRLDISSYGINHLGADGYLAVGPTSTVTWYGGGLDLGDQLVFNRYDSTLYRVTVAEDTYDDYGGLYVSSAHAIVRLEGVTDLSGADLILA
jgi:Ca2+-binding RTX toxin-like protein